jgi:hypothetical protein
MTRMQLIRTLASWRPDLTACAVAPITKWRDHLDRPYPAAAPTRRESVLTLSGWSAGTTAE